MILQQEFHFITLFLFVYYLKKQCQIRVQEIKVGLKNIK